MTDKNSKSGNLLSNYITTAGKHSAYDESCKRLLANKQILAQILQMCVEEFRNCSVKDIEEKYIEGSPEIAKVAVHQDENGEFIKGMNTEDATMTEGKVTFDIRFHAIAPQDERQIGLILNLEAQNDFYTGYPLVKRGIYYGSRLISAQYGTEFYESGYEKIKKVYSIWICTCPPRYRRNTITSYSFEEKNLIGQANEKKENYDLITVVMVCLGESDSSNYSGLLKMLDVLLSNEKKPEEKKWILHNEFNIAMSKNMESEVSDMCNLSQAIWQQGVDDAMIDSILKIMDNLKKNVSEAMDILEIPHADRDGYLKIIEEKRAKNL